MKVGPPNRAVEIAGFLSHHGWDNADTVAFSADFSSRRYARLIREDQKVAILMDADPEHKTPQFITVNKILSGLEISVPTIYAADPMRGLVLMEDFGTRNIGSLFDAGASRKPYIESAIEVLLHIHKEAIFEPDIKLALPCYDTELFISQAELFLDSFVPFLTERESTPLEKEGFRGAWEAAFQFIGPLPQSLLLRDFMPDNLMDLPQRDAWRKVGVLDFQDAGFGPIAYDLASLGEVVRRDGEESILTELTHYYSLRNPTALPAPLLLQACHVLAAQRHTRVLGILSRRALEGRREVLKNIPRVKNYLQQLLVAEPLRQVREFMESTHWLD